MEQEYGIKRDRADLKIKKEKNKQWAEYSTVLEGVGCSKIKLTVIDCSILNSEVLTKITIMS